MTSADPLSLQLHPLSCLGVLQLSWSARYMTQQPILQVVLSQTWPFRRAAVWEDVASA